MFCFKLPFSFIVILYVLSFIIIIIIITVFSLYCLPLANKRVHFSLRFLTITFTSLHAKQYVAKWWFLLSFRNQSKKTYGFINKK